MGALNDAGVYSPEHKIYVYVHQHLSTPQKAIQGMHVVQTMVAHAVGEEPFLRWRISYAPIVFKNGGGTKWMKRLYDILVTDPMLDETGDALDVAWSVMHEDDDTLGGLLTAVALYMSDDEVLPYDLRTHLNSSGGLVRS